MIQAIQVLRFHLLELEKVNAKMKEQAAANSRICINVFISASV